MIAFRTFPIGRILGAALLAFLSAAPSRAAESPVIPQRQAPIAAPEMPQREREFIAIFNDVYRISKGRTSLKDIRLKIQTQVIKFLSEDPEAKNWTGVVRNIGTATGGSRWISIEIAPNVKISTCRDRTCDPTGITLINPYSPLFQVVAGNGMGDRVVFSAHIYGGLITDDVAMVEAPEMLANFTMIKIPD